MDFNTWEPVYERILADMGYDRVDDERARDVYAGLLRASEADTFGDGLDFTGERVAIAGAAPSLEDELATARAADTVVAASSAGQRLLANGIAVDCLVTDLDGEPDTAVRLTNYETPVAIHAHGDNAIVIREYVPRCRLDSVIPTTQAAPRHPVRNFGGFTDGDRAAFLADHFGASELVFPGWAFDDPTVGPTKRRKLRWAERLLHWLERRRGDRFGVLDGRRDGIDPIDP
ncbi:6-hydroxymethylpterin diphosphokinase MptE-like protein [Halapricum desulfuricans]|uniref:6-hydroxymethyl-7,8-dihydropterin pyrophosphokinase n=1 Tax=Halapricum desulfuricans TaxID=2841257 RepID=A0A897NLF7_9EURY|nr:6-hydroxymethylpterin diphosphokinase MptE-like protein [Halapricum desulfuricans]QSG15320.1 putative Rossmann fold enzyme [Halapricum desulfuricans]